jgi:hypothetical protein
MFVPFGARCQEHLLFLSEPNPYPVLATRAERATVLRYLYTLCHVLLFRRLVKRAHVLEGAAVPIIKAHMGGPSNLQVDICMGASNGPTAVTYMSQQVRKSAPQPALTPLLSSQNLPIACWLDPTPLNPKRPYTLRSLVTHTEDQAILALGVVGSRFHYV